MALINCPECGRNNVSDSAKRCPGCGYPICGEAKSKTMLKDNPKLVIGGIVAFAIVIFILVVISSEEKTNPIDRYYYDYDYSYSSNNNSGRDASSIFKKLDIDDFSCSLGKYSGQMQCIVTNNNSFTVNGYFRVNFYDSNGKLMYNQLMSLPDVAPGESIVCSTSIPKDDYPSGYSSVDFSQASLIDSD